MRYKIKNQLPTPSSLITVQLLKLGHFKPDEHKIKLLTARNLSEKREHFTSRVKLTENTMEESITKTERRVDKTYNSTGEGRVPL